MTSTLSRRSLFAGSAKVGAAVALGTVVPWAVPAEAEAAEATGPVFGPVTVDATQGRYADLVVGTNARWVGTPDRIRLVGSTDQVVTAVREELAAGRKIAVRSGGHCYEDFVSNRAVRTVLDMSGMDGVWFDAARSAFVVQPGALLGDAYKALYKGWGVTIPGGTCPTVGAGGHIAGGGYGALSRLHGLVVDHLYAVEVVVVGADGSVRAVVATRAADDPNRDLWWAHTGGGGGNFGVVTKYWFRSPSATGSDPTRLLPAPPARLLVRTVTWSWADLDATSFQRLLANYGRFFEGNSAPSSPYASLFSQLKPQHKSAGSFGMTSQMDAAAPDAAALFDRFHAAVGEGVPAMTVADSRTLPWLHATTQWPGFTAPDTSTRFKAKSAYMRRGFTPANTLAFYKHLTTTSYDHPLAIVMMSGYGGAINAVGPTATAVPQRDSVLKLHYIVFWTDPVEDAKHLGWLRGFYREVYAATGGVPGLDGDTDGCFVNYADIDLGDPALNTSGTPWTALYYKGVYPQLQAVKKRWDPRNTFSHAQSIALPGGH